VKLDIWEDVGAFNGNPHLFSLTIRTLDYLIPIKNIWILSFPRFTLDMTPFTLFRGLRNPIMMLWRGSVE
jgi:hypothetical protein